MQNDPYPEVAKFAKRVVSFFISKAHCFDQMKRTAILQQQDSQTNRRFSNDITNRTNQTVANTDKQENVQQISTEFVPWCRKYFLKVCNYL